MTMLAALLLVTAYSQAQEVYMSDVSGTALRKDSRYAEVEGTPFLYTDWSDGVVVFKSNKVIKSIPLKYNIESEDIYFKSPQTGNEMLFVDPVASFKINGITFQNGFNPIDSYSNKTYYQVLSDGRVKLLKKTNKTIMEVTEYNAPKRRVFKENFSYYVANEKNDLTKVKKDNSILNLLKDKEDLVKAFVSKNKLNLKKDEDLSKVFDYYNSL